MSPKRKSSVVADNPANEQGWSQWRIVRALLATRQGEAVLSRPSQNRRLHDREQYSPSILQVVLMNTALSTAYTVLTIARIERPNSLLGNLMQSWLDLSENLFSTFFFFMPEPASLTNPRLASRVSEYRHALLMCVFLTLWSVLASRPHWPLWSDQLKRKLNSVRGTARGSSEFLGHAYRMMVIGLVAVAALMLVGEPRSEAAVAILYGNSWTFLRAPVLTAVACALACHAAALRSSVPPN